MRDDLPTAIVHHLRRDGDATVSEISSALGMSTVTVRHHLVSLLQAGVVEAYPRHRPSGPGRPEKAYRLTHAAVPFLPANFEDLASGLVEHLCERLPPDEFLRLLRASAGRLGARLAYGWPSVPAIRRDGALDALAARGYFPAWSEGPGGHLLSFRHCPYVSIAARVPALCGFDEGLLEGLLGCEVRLEQSIAQEGPACVFRPLTYSPSSG